MSKYKIGDFKVTDVFYTVTQMSEDDSYVYSIVFRLIINDRFVVSGFCTTWCEMYEIDKNECWRDTKHQLHAYKNFDANEVIQSANFYIDIDNIMNLGMEI